MTSKRGGQPQRVRRQHIVSRFYLRGFANEDGRLQRVALPGHHRHLVSLDDATVIKDFYTLDLGDGTQSDLFERAFGKIEGPASGALQRVVRDGQWPLDEEDKAWLAGWVALQHLRSEAIRNSQTEMQAHMIRILVGASGKAALREHIESAEGRPIGDDRLNAEWDDLTRPGGPALTPDVRSHMATVVDMLPRVTAHFASLQWSLNVFERKVLVTSDHPVTLLEADNHPKWSGIGLANAGGFALALSRRLGLVLGASPELPDLRVPGSSKMARALNGRVIFNARHSIFHHPDDAAVLGDFTLPERRVKETGPINDDHFIREEGLFSDLTEEAKRAWQSMDDALHGPEDRGISLRDIEWPIPGRRFTWKSEE